MVKGLFQELTEDFINKKEEYLKVVHGIDFKVNNCKLVDHNIENRAIRSIQNKIKGGIKRRVY